MSFPLNIRLTLMEVEALLKLFLTFFSHMIRERSTSFLHQSKMFNILMSTEEHLTSVELCKNASHWPNITFHVPLLAIKYNFWRPVLARIYNLSVVLFFISSASKVNNFNLDISWSVPNIISLFLLCFSSLMIAFLITWVFVTSLTAKNFSFVQDLKRPACLIWNSIMLISF